MTRKQTIKLYWLWKLHAMSLKNIVKNNHIAPHTLMKIFNSLDREFEMENWRVTL